MNWSYVALWWYLGVGGLNVAAAGGQGKLMLNQERSAAAFVEVAFYLLLWPVQVAFWTFVGISSLLDWIGFHLMGGASKRGPKHRKRRSDRGL